MDFSWPLFIAGVLISWTLIGLATAIYFSRHYRFLTPAETDQDDIVEDANHAIVGAIRSSLTEHPYDWEIDSGGLAHKNGTHISFVDGTVWLKHEGCRSMIHPHLAMTLILAVQARNAKIMLDDLNPGKVN